MKKIFYLLIFATLVATTACSDLLNEESKVEVDKNNYMNDASEAESVLLGVYRAMVSDGLYGYNLSMLFTISTDIAQCEGSSATNFREIPANAFNTTNASVQSTWQSLYAAVYCANDFLETIGKKKASFSDADKALAEIYIAEAKALRALYYFELVRWFGNIALMQTTADSYKEPKSFVQAPAASVYEFIEKDLTEAAAALPWSIEDSARKNSSFRFSRGAALGLLAKVYATWAGYPVLDTSKWQKAAQTAALVVNSGKHSLNPSFENVWYNTCNGIWYPQESLIEVSFYASAITGTASEDPAGRIGKWNGVIANAINGVRGRNAGNYKVVYTFIEDFASKNDPRYELSIANYKYVGTNKTYFSNVDISQSATDAKNWQVSTPAKWDTEKYVQSGNYLINADKSNVNWYILRYSDVLLLYAEALNEWKGAPTDEALAAVNMVRRRGFGVDMNTANAAVDIPNSLTHEEFRQAIRKERAYELCFEGHRRQDLIRWGIYYETIVSTAQKLFNWNSSANYVSVQYTTKNKHELFPIPQRDMDLMSQFKQNTGWK